MPKGDLYVNIAELEKQIDDLTTLHREIVKEKTEVEQNRDVIAQNWEGDDFETANGKMSEIIKILTSAADDLEKQLHFIQAKKENFSENMIRL